MKMRTHPFCANRVIHASRRHSHGISPASGRSARDALENTPALGIAPARCRLSKF